MDFQAGEEHDEEGGLLAGINMIPLIDVMLVLLIVFMLSAPLSFSSIDVRLPSGAAAPQDPELTESSFLEVVISREGEVFFEEQVVSLKILGERLQQKDKGKAQRLLVRADESVVYARVIAVMNAARRAGMQHISLVMREEGSLPQESL